MSVRTPTVPDADALTVGDRLPYLGRCGACAHRAEAALMCCAIL